MTPEARTIRDLKLFSDLATPFESVSEGDQVRISMIRGGEPRAYSIDLRSGVVIEHRGGRQHRFPSLGALLATDVYANIRSLRETQRRLLQGVPFDDYLPPSGVMINGAATGKPLTLESFRSALTLCGTASTLQVLLIDGPAGVGKTSLIERMVFERSDAASSQPPILHVRSSGSRLTDLNKALAHATQVLRAAITFDQVPVLVRHGVLQVAIDGFDELVDPAGYKDAWFALREFLQEVDTGGPILLAGRDTFFDQQSFQEKLARRVSNLSLRTARLSAASPSGAFEYLGRHGWTDDDVRAARDAGWFREGSYRLRPFFLAQIAKAGGWSELRDSYGSPQWFLVSTFVRREAELVSRMISLDVSVAANALWRFYGTIAEDMAGHEDEAVDLSYLSLACELAFEGIVGTDDLAKLTHKAASFGLLETHGAAELRRFPHTELQEQFLARRIRDSLVGSAGLTQYMRRQAVPAGLAEAFGEQFMLLSDAEAGEVYRALDSCVTGQLFSTTLFANVLALRLATLSRPASPGAGSELGPGTLVDARLVGTIRAVTLKEITFSVLDLRSADCVAVVFDGCSTATLLVDELTRFGQTAPRIDASLQIDETHSRTIRIPHDIAVWVREHSIRPERADASHLPLVRFFDRVCRAFARQYQVRDCSDDGAYHLLRDPLWDEVVSLLGDRMMTTYRTTGGTRDAFYVVRDPYDLLAPRADDSESVALRQRVEERAQELAGA